MLNFILGFDEPSNKFVNGDMNDDQVLNVLDVIRIVNNILGLINRDFSYGQNNFGMVNYSKSGNDDFINIFRN